MTVEIIANLNELRMIAAITSDNTKAQLYLQNIKFNQDHSIVATDGKKIMMLENYHDVDLNQDYYLNIDKDVAKFLTQHKKYPDVTIEFTDTGQATITINRFSIKTHTDNCYYPEYQKLLFAPNEILFPSPSALHIDQAMQLINAIRICMPEFITMYFAVQEKITKTAALDIQTMGAQLNKLIIADPIYQPRLHAYLMPLIIDTNDMRANLSGKFIVNPEWQEQGEPYEATA